MDENGRTILESDSAEPLELERHEQDRLFAPADAPMPGQTSLELE